jgi:hypothetical protein
MRNSSPAWRPPIIIFVATYRHFCCCLLPLVTTFQVDWDVELALCGCGMNLPDCIEDDFLSKLSELVVRSFTQQNPISIDMNNKAAADPDELPQERDSV